MTGRPKGKECELGGLECSHKPDTSVGWSPHEEQTDNDLQTFEKETVCLGQINTF